LKSSQVDGTLWAGGIMGKRGVAASLLALVFGLSAIVASYAADAKHPEDCGLDEKTRADLTDVVAYWRHGRRNTALGILYRALRQEGVRETDVRLYLYSNFTEGGELYTAYAQQFDSATSTP